MTQGARPHPDTVAAVKQYLQSSKRGYSVSIGKVARHYGIDRTTLSKALKKHRALNTKGK